MRSALIRATLDRSTVSSASTAIADRSPRYRISVRKVSLTPSSRRTASLMTSPGVSAAAFFRWVFGGSPTRRTTGMELALLAMGGCTSLMLPASKGQVVGPRRHRLPYGNLRDPASSRYSAPSQESDAGRGPRDLREGILLGFSLGCRFNAVVSAPFQTTQAEQLGRSSFGLLQNVRFAICSQFRRCA